MTNERNIEILLAKHQDCQEILKLQQQNLKMTLNQEESKTQGFVTLSHTIEDLTAMNSPHPHIVAKDGDKLAGYALMMTPEHNDRFPKLFPLFDLSLAYEYKGKAIQDWSYFTMGQVCVAKEYRGLALVDRMYERMKQEVKGRFDLILTFIDRANTRSIRVHERTGWQVLDIDETAGWIAVVLEV